MKTSDQGHALFVETREYRRFIEFCEACRRYRYIGLCFGRPGVGKTLSARRYTRSDALTGLPKVRHMTPSQLQETGDLHTVLYTVPVVNTPGIVERGLDLLRRDLHDIRLEPSHRDQEEEHEQVRAYELRCRQELNEYLLTKHDWLSGPPPERPRTHPTHDEVNRKFQELRRQIPDPTDLILIDEADRLKMASLEAARAVFDRGGIGLVLIGMPGIEKRMARYPQFYSRIGFVHEFCPLDKTEVHRLLVQGWTPAEVHLPSLDEEAIAAVIRITGGNFRLMDRLLSQTERIVSINQLSSVSREVVEAARESLVIGQA